MPADRRLTEVRHLNMHYTFPGYATKEEWLARAGEIREHLLVSTGLRPEPKRTPLKAKVFGKLERDGYSIEKVHFQSYPGFYVCGNLYRPLGKKGPFPGIVSPHGHWQRGRLESIERGSIPGRCINFARQGYVTFAYDMVGYNDSKQVIHRKWGGEVEHLWGISPMGLQLWNGIRAVDFLQSLPEVDPERIGCTGASGGGTQTFMLMSVDDRVKVAAPVNMISAYMQGGCVCENAPGLRTSLYNVELGAMMAPRPLLMVCCTGDWTKHTPKEEYPDVRGVYKLFGATDRVASVQIDAEHNYNKDSREAVYRFFGKWLLNEANPATLKEQPFEVEPDEDMLVFPDGKLPTGALTQKQLVAQLRATADAQIESLKPKSKKRLAAFKATMRPALRHALSCEVPKTVVTLKRDRGEVGGFATEELVLSRKGRGDRVRLLLLLPKDGGDETPTTVLAHPKGLTGLVTATGPKFLVRRLLARGHAVAVVECFLPEGTADPRDYKGLNFVDTYNLTDTANRVQDLLTASVYLAGRKDVPSLTMAGVGETGLWCLLAQAIGQAAERVVADAAKFASMTDEEYLKRLYVPNLRRVGGFRTVAALLAPTPLLLHNTGGKFGTGWYRDVYRIGATRGSLRTSRDLMSDSEIADWLSG